MTTLTIKTYPNNSKRIEKAENDIFSWDNDIESDSLLHKDSGRYIYQSRWIENGKMTDRVDDETKKEFMKFWSDLEADKKEIATVAPTNTTPAIKQEDTSWFVVNEFGERELSEDC